MLSRRIAISMLVVSLAACERASAPVPRSPDTPQAAPAPTAAAPPPHRVDSRPPPLARPVPFWQAGAVARDIDAATAAEHGFVLIDLADTWVPYLFSERGNEAEERKPNRYRATYLALARGEFPDDHHGARAQQDKYLELYGIMPTLGLMRTRFQEVRDLDCRADLDLAPIRAFDGFVSYQSNEVAQSQVREFQGLEAFVARIVARQGVADVASIDRSRLSDAERGRLSTYERRAPRVLALRAAQARLECEGYFRGKGRFLRGALDWPTHEALAEFEKRHRIFGWGFFGRDTLEALRADPMENERESLIRVLLERAMHAAGVLEDGSIKKADGTPRTFRGADGREHEVPNLEAQLRERVIAAFGLETPDKALAWLEALGELGAENGRVVAIEGPPLPEYYDGDMDFSVVIDRGDVWYDFLLDDRGQEVSQPVERRPNLTIRVHYLDQDIPIARFGTTIGGWRSEFIGGMEWWKYKNSPVGDVVWRDIVASPVWLPPESTPPRDLVKRRRGGYSLNYHETGPSYASAYGLVAAYHRNYRERDDGDIHVWGDEGIRTHGSVDYMSIMRRHSHGCHRLHNHIAVRLMSFVLAHRPHTRVGQQMVNFQRDFEHDGHRFHMQIDEGGYVFELARPLRVSVLEGRVQGRTRRPVETPIPKFNRELQAYVLPDGGAVAVARDGTLTPTTFPVLDAGVGLDAGVPLAP